MGRKLNLTDHQIYEMMEYRRENKPVSEIAKIYNVCEVTVYNYTNHVTGVELNNSINEAKKEKAINLKRNGDTLQQISKKCDISVKTAINYTKGIPSRSRKTGIPKNFTSQQLKEMEQMRRNGVPVNKIANHNECSISTVYYHVGHIKSPNKPGSISKSRLNKNNVNKR